MSMGRRTLGKQLERNLLSGYRHEILVNSSFHFVTFFISHIPRRYPKSTTNSVVCASSQHTHEHPETLTSSGVSVPPSHVLCVVDKVSNFIDYGALCAPQAATRLWAKYYPSIDVGFFIIG